MYCTKCGAKIIGKFCINCGAPAPAAQQSVQLELQGKASKRKPKKKRAPLLLGCSLGFLALMGVAGSLGNTSTQTPQELLVQTASPSPSLALIIPTDTATPMPTDILTPMPTTEPTATPAPKLTLEPTASPTPESTPKPTASATPESTPKPTASPMPKPTSKPTASPTPKPTSKPTASPTPEPTPKPTASPTPKPTKTPAATTEPTETPASDDVPYKENYHGHVYITKTGKKYHYENPCGKGTYYEVSWDKVKSLGLEPCEKCVLH